MTDLPAIPDLIASDDQDAIREILKKGDNVDKLYDGVTLLFHAIDCYKIKICRLLLKNGANPNKIVAIPNPYKQREKVLYWAPLSRAVFNQCPQIVKLLIDHGADIHYKNIVGLGAVDFANLVNDTVSLEILTSMGAKGRNPPVKNLHTIIEEGLPLHEATLNNKPYEMERLLKEGHVDDQDVFGNTALHIAAGCGSHVGLALLLKYGANPNIANDKKYVPLHYTARGNSNILTDLLLKFGADINAKGFLGHTPLHEAVMKSNLSGTQFLLYSGANVNIKSQTRMTPLHVALVERKLPIVKALMKVNPDIFCKDCRGISPLQFAAECWPGVLNTLIKDNLNVQSTDGDTLLHVATETNTKTVSHLLSKGIDIKKKNNKGNTPLHSACLQPNLESVQIVKLLVAKGSKVNEKNNLGHTPLHLCTKGRFVKRIEYLLSCGADANILDKCLRSPLHYASEIGDVTIINMLLSYGANTALKDHCNNTPMMIAAKNAHFPCVKAFLIGNAPLWMEDK